MLTEYYFSVRYEGIVILLYHEDMMLVWELLLFKNSQKEKIFRILLYDRCKSSIRRFERRKTHKKKGGGKVALKFAKEHDMCMTAAQIQDTNNM